MINTKIVKNPMPEQKPEIRKRNFNEVSTGYTSDMAVNEAMRCYNCRTAPCMSGCPVNIKIPDFIRETSKGNFEEAYKIISETSSLPAICGRVCPQENQCEGRCVRGKKGEPVGIGRLERFVADWHADHSGEGVYVKEGGASDEGKHRVAIVGSGPAGLACAGDLINAGYDVTVYESLHKTGGVLVYGIPEFRLPKAIVARETEALAEKGVKFITNAIIGRVYTVDELMDEEGYEAVFVGTGAGLPSFMNIEGENLNGVCAANEYLTRINLMKAYLPEYDTPIKKAKNIAVVGGGNVAMDAARCAMRMGADNVYVIYRRSAEEMPARAEEVHHAVEEGITFMYLTNPVRMMGDEKGSVTGVECIKMELGEPDASGRRKPEPVEGSNFVLDADFVIMSIGTRLNKLVLETTESMEPNDRGGIAVDDKGATTKPGVFAGGDAVTGAATVIKAMGAGKTAAKAIMEYLG